MEKVVKFYDYFKLECFGLAFLKRLREILLLKFTNREDCCEENAVTKTKRVTQWYQIDDNDDLFDEPYKSEAKWLKDWGYETDNWDTDETESDNDEDWTKQCVLNIEINILSSHGLFVLAFVNIMK